MFFSEIPRVYLPPVINMPRTILVGKNRIFRSESPGLEAYIAEVTLARSLAVGLL